MIEFFVFLIGTVVGSFLNVCIYRIPRHKSILFPGSHCPRCKKDIIWYDNIPILSYIALLGRCGYCKKKISFRYPLVEFLTAVMMVCLYLKFGFTGHFFVYTALVSALIAVSFVDLETHEIPDEISLGGLVIGLIVAFALPSMLDGSNRWTGLAQSALRVLAGGGSIYIMGALGSVAFKKEAMGGGDVKLMAMIGSVLGWKLVLLAFFIAPVFGAFVGVIAKVRHGSETIPYGPYLSLGAVIAIFFGNSILRLLFYGL